MWAACVLFALILSTVQTPSSADDDSIKFGGQTSDHGGEIFGDNGRIISDSGDKRILSGPTKPIKLTFTCNNSREIRTRVVCSCNTKAVPASLHQYSESFFVVDRFGPDVKELELVLCSIHLKADFFRNLRAKELSVVEFNGADLVTVQPRALTFEHQRVKAKIVFKLVGRLVLETGAVGAGVDTIQFNQVRFQNFTSDAFQGIDPKSSIGFSNCSIKTHPEFDRVSPRRIFLDTMHFFNTDIDVRDYTLLELSANRVTFDHCRLDLYLRNAFVFVDTVQVVIQDSAMDLLGDALHMIAYEVVLQNVELKQPKKSAFAQLYAANETATLVLNNLTLSDPSRGTLFTGFPNVHYHNIIVSFCLCELEHYLLDDKDLLGLRSMLNHEENRQQLIRQLVNETRCYSRSKQELVMPIELCKSRQEEIRSTYGFYVVILLIVFGLGILLVSAFVYRWHRIIRRRLNTLNSLRIVAPNATYRETTVQFNNKVEVFARPSSSLGTYLITGDPTAPISHSYEDLHNPPDLVKGLQEMETPTPQGSSSVGLARLDSLEKSTLEMIQELDETEEELVEAQEETMPTPVLAVVKQEERGEGTRDSNMGSLDSVVVRPECDSMIIRE